MEKRIEKIYDNNVFRAILIAILAMFLVGFDGMVINHIILIIREIIDIVYFDATAQDLSYHITMIVLGVVGSTAVSIGLPVAFYDSWMQKKWFPNMWEDEEESD